MNLNNITNIAGSIVYSDIFENHNWIKNSYELFLKEANQNDPMYDSLMHLYSKKYKDDPNHDYVFIPENDMDLYVENQFSKIKNVNSYYPSNIDHNMLLFCGYENIFNKLWYVYFDISDYLTIFVKPELNNIFKKSYLLDKYSIYDEESIHFNKIKNLNNEIILLGFFYSENKGF